MIRRVSVLILSTALAVGACTDQNPTAVGDDLLRGGDVHTAEVVLDAAEFLEGTESYSGFTRAEGAQFTMIAREFGGAVDAHALARFTAPPATVTYDDADGETQTDSLPTYIGGEVVVNVDSTRTATDVPVELEVRRVSEAWDAASATWAVRIDSGDVRESWSEPGGTTDAVLGTAVWEPGDESARIPVDSQTVAAWVDSEGETPEILVASRTAGVRIFGTNDAVELELRARPSERPDTVVTASLGRAASAVLFDPPPNAAPDRLRVGGTPAWRSFLRFRDRLDTLTLQVPTDSGALSVALGDATVNYASVLLQPAPVAEGYVPEDSLRLRAHRVLPADGVPLVRSAVESEFVGRLATPVPRSAFAGATADPAELPITGFVQGLVEPADSAADATLATDLAVLSPDRQRFGFGAFTAAGAESDPPRLRLIVTITTEIEFE